MAGNIIMLLSSYVFGLLFAFLMLVLITAFISNFKKVEKREYEPKVSVVVPCYNEEKDIGKCLDSIYASNYPKDKMDVVVVDDGSSDNSLRILEEYKKKYEGLEIIQGKHGGKSEALNLGVEKAKNEIIFTVDADTIVGKNTLKRLVLPFVNDNVGATNGSCVARNKKSFWGMFQNVEYHYNNLIRKSFSVLFNNGIWFYGAFACYRKSLLDKIGGFKKDSMTEDADIALEIYANGFKTVNVHDAFGYVLVPTSLKALISQRTRWWIGVLQSLKKNRNLFSRKSSPSILFLFVNQYWWSFYALISLPIIAYQFNYWLPSNIGSIGQTFMYTFRWFSLLGPFHVLYKIPEWGINLYSFFGVMSGVISALLITKAFYIFKEKLSFRSILGIFFYFPYTIVLNTIIIISLIKIIFLKRAYFIY